MVFVFPFLAQQGAAVLPPPFTLTSGEKVDNVMQLVLCCGSATTEGRAQMPLPEGWGAAYGAQLDDDQEPRGSVEALELLASIALWYELC